MHSAMILAAGRGERLRPITDGCPKPMVRVLDKPLMQFHLEKLIQAGFKRVVINYAWLGEQIESYFGDGQSFGVEIVYSPEAMALETGGGIAKALPLLGDEPFFVVNGDIYCEMPFERLPQLQEIDVGHLFLVPNPEHHPEGDYSLDGDRIMNKQEQSFTFSGMGIYHPKMFQDAPSGAFPIPQIWRGWIEHQQISGEVIEDYWLDIGTIDRLEELKSRLA